MGLKLQEYIKSKLIFVREKQSCLGTLSSANTCCCGNLRKPCNFIPKLIQRRSKIASLSIVRGNDNFEVKYAPIKIAPRSCHLILWLINLFTLESGLFPLFLWNNFCSNPAAHSTKCGLDRTVSSCTTKLERSKWEIKHWFFTFVTLYKLNQINFYGFSLCMRSWTNREALCCGLKLLLVQVQKMQICNNKLLSLTHLKVHVDTLWKLEAWRSFSEQQLWTPAKWLSTKRWFKV